MQATLTFLGSGTSMGVPTLGCECAVCKSATPAGPGLPAPQPHNRRTRPSVLIAWQGHNVVIDTGPDFHAQAIRENIRRLDAVLYTHGHADHVLGMDDLRPLTFGNQTFGNQTFGNQTFGNQTFGNQTFHNAGNLPLYADDPTATTIERIFDYTFNKQRRYPTSARVTLNRISSEPGTIIDLFGAHFQRIPVTHGQQTITGYRFGSAAYLTDVSSIPEDSIPLLADLDILILDALRREPHPTHSSLDNSIRLVERLKPRRAFFTHMSHDLDHEATNAILPPHIRLAYDGLKLKFDIAPVSGEITE
jgi:phosphoribosyl 1,2-cyclic phosphate phosphodiesterase